MNEGHLEGLVRRVVDEAMLGGRLDALDEVFVPERVPIMREWITPFRASFPDLRMEIVAIIAEEGYVAGHFRCSGTHLGPWRGHQPTGRRFEAIDELYFFEATGDRLGMMWSVEDTTKRMSQLGLS